MRAARKAQAAQFAANVLPIIREIQAAGYIAVMPSPDSSTLEVATANGSEWRPGFGSHDARLNV
jgi:hypothetical protein